MAVPESFAEVQANGGVMVHLPRLRWRALHSLGRLREAGFERIELEEGVDGFATDPRAVAEAEGWFFDPGLGPGEIGCSLSMIRLWQRVVRERLPYLLVFEDDVLPHPDIARLGAEYWAETPRDAELVLMGNQMWAPDIAALPDPRRRVVTLPTSCLHAYVVTERGARRALDLLAAELANDRWLSVIDLEVRRWMVRWDIRYACWNGTMLARPFPSAHEIHGSTNVPPDVARSSCGSTGPFWQNHALGSSIWPDREPPVPAAGRARRRPRAVLLTPFAPSRSGNGSAIRAGVALEALAAQHDVDLVLVPVYGQSTVDDWAARLTRSALVLPETVADPFLRRVPLMPSEDEQRRARVTYPRPMQAMFSTPEAAAEIVRFMGGEADVVYAFRLPVAPLAEPWLSLGAARPRFVLDIDEDDAGATRQIAALKRLESDDDAARVADADADKLAAMARAWIPHVDLVLAAAHPEVGRLRAQYPGINADVLPNPAPPTGEEGPAPDVDLLFVGNCSYTPNIDAARWLCLEVLPILRAQLGRPVRVAVVGSAVDAAVEALAGDSDVVVAADVPSVTPWYRAARVSVAPLRAGGGTRLKILEAFAHRRPVVSTSLGAEGLPVTDGVHLLIADGADDIATACARLLADHDLRTQLVGAAVKVAIAHARPRIVSDLVHTIAGVGSRLEATHA